MPLYSPFYYNDRALIGGARIRRRSAKRGGVSSSLLSGMQMVRRNTPVRKGSAAAKAKMAALRRLRGQRRRRL